MKDGNCTLIVRSTAKKELITRRGSEVVITPAQLPWTLAQICGERNEARERNWHGQRSETFTGAPIQLPSASCPSLQPRNTVWRNSPSWDFILSQSELRFPGR